MIKLDHVVYFTEKSPDDVVNEQEKMGWHAVIGGSHEKWGTHNALMYVGNAYIEWLSVENKNIAEKSDHQLVNLLLRDVPDGEAWGTICLTVDDIESFDMKIRARGYQTSGAIQAERKTASGDIRKWKMLFVDQQPSANLPLPFFIEWEKDDEERFNELREDGTILPDNEKLIITECIFTVNDPEKAAEEWSSLLSTTHSENTIALPNADLKFIGKEQKVKEERLAEVVIEHV
ncbi:VOC family protein [Sporosarcina sp. Marseille-Q4063]|uniref:VOC family protein n=1 Tax=Sporosarcina sp. Marseille-Q4063 TaxID=2810514 RepID=UPI001BB06B7E|nr:VOC family protein [Sporosarcina sp. Marseille-Q4063]QUW23794.1 VOC family protein [Sporosarcina sp. Marseille-Q4063]